MKPYKVTYHTQAHNGKCWYRPEHCGDLAVALSRLRWDAKFAWGNRPCRIIRQNLDGSMTVFASFVR